MGDEDASKRFFFEKKKQKTSAELDRGCENGSGPFKQMFFGYFFSKK